MELAEAVVAVEAGREQGVLDLAQARELAVQALEVEQAQAVAAIALVQGQVALEVAGQVRAQVAVVQALETAALEAAKNNLNSGNSLLFYFLSSTWFSSPTFLISTISSRSSLLTKRQRLVRGMSGNFSLSSASNALPSFSAKN